jgi:hypothetical protein
VATNVYFNNFETSGEQNLIANLVMESIKMYGNDVYYLKYTDPQTDKIYGESNSREYNSAELVEMYIKSVDGFGGDGQFLSKFNLEVRDTITFSVSIRSFENEIGFLHDISRPREGDLIWFVPSSRMFKITYVEKYPVFLQLGTVSFYDVKCEMFEYSGERINTGVIPIDSVFEQISPSLNIESIHTEDGLEIIAEDGYSLLNEAWDINTSVITADNDEIEAEADAFINFSEIDPFSEGAYGNV